jgi:demethylsterigmatocystin 6-O-methyltransferase
MSSSCSKSDVLKLIPELKALKHNASIDEVQRHELCAALQEASLAVESPLETINRIIFSVSLPSRSLSIKN